MYLCERCHGTFASFTTPGQCPLCGTWAHVQCQGCRYTAHANEFINNNDRCPKCGSIVSVPGGSDSASPVGCLSMLMLAPIVYGICSWVSH
jgi:rubrerythrin